MDNEKKKDIELNTPEMNTETDSPITAGDLIKKLKSNLNQQTNNHNEAKENEAESLREDDVKKSGDGSENDHVSVTESVKRLIESLKENEEDESESKDTDKGNNAEAVTDEEESESTVNDQQSIEAAREEISEKEYSVVIEKKADKTNIFDPSTLKQNSKSKDKAKLFEENEQPAVAEAEQLTFNMTEDDIHKSIEEAEAFIYDRERIDNPEELINDAEGNTGEHSAFTQGSDEEGYDQTDLWIASAFGDEDEVKNKYGEKAAQEVETQLDIDAQEYLNDQNKEVKTVKIDQEFNSVDQIKEIFARYRKSHKMSLIKMAVCLLLVVAAFVFENISAFGGHLPGALNKNNYPAIYILASLQFLVFAGTVAYEELYRGVRALIKLAPLPESITACAVALSAIYHIVQCFVSETDPSVALYVSPVILCIFVTLLYDFLNLKREIYSFNIVASKRPKYTITAVETDNARLENEAFGEYLSGEEDISMFKIGKTGFVKGFYERMNSYSKSNSIISILLSVAAVSGLIFFIITTVLYDVKTALSFGYLAFVFATPACSLLAFSLPFYKASKKAFNDDSAIIGNASLDEYANANTLSFEDKDVFPSYGVKVKSIKVYGESRIDKVLYNAASIFSIIGGPLSDVFDTATHDIGKSENIEIIEIQKDGIEAIVDGSHVYVGKAAYLKKCGYSPAVEPEDDEIESTGEASIMYMVCDGDICARMDVQYTIDPDFEAALKKLYKAGICIGIKTFDPNIDDKLLGSKVNITKYPVRILRCDSLEETTKTEDEADSGIVSKASPRNLLNTFVLCSKVLFANKSGATVKILSVAFSILLMSFLLVFGKANAIPSLYVGLYQLFWMVPVYLISKFYV